MEEENKKEEEIVAAGEEIKPEQAEEQKEAKKEDKKWYVIQTYSGQEEQVKESIEHNIDRIGMREKIFQILVPEEEIVEMRGKKRIEKKKKMFPGYVFIEMTLDDES